MSKIVKEGNTFYKVWDNYPVKTGEDVYSKVLVADPALPREYPLMEYELTQTELYERFSLDFHEILDIEAETDKKIKVFEKRLETSGGCNVKESKWFDQGLKYLKAKGLLTAVQISNLKLAKPEWTEDMVVL